MMLSMTSIHRVLGAQSVLQTSKIDKICVWAVEFVAIGKLITKVSELRYNFFLEDDFNRLNKIERKACYQLLSWSYNVYHIEPEWIVKNTTGKPQTLISYWTIHQSCLQSIINILKILWMFSGSDLVIKAILWNISEESATNSNRKS